MYKMNMGGKKVKVKQERMKEVKSNKEENKIKMKLRKTVEDKNEEL